MYQTFGNVRINLQEVESTNAFAMSLLSSGDCENGTLIIAHSQTAGRGQRGTTWESEPGKNLTFSIVLKSIRLLPTEHFVLSKMVALALINVLQDIVLYPDLLKIKWPNDIYYGDKKLAGILVENKFRGNKLEASVIGIGLNVNQAFFSDNINETTTSIIQITNKSLELNIVLEKIIDELQKGYFLLNSSNSNLSIEKAYKNHLFGLDFRNYKVLENNEKLRLKIIDVLSNGQVIMIDELQLNYKFWFKEIELVNKNRGL